LTVSNRGISAPEPMVKWSSIIAWVLSMLIVPCASVFATIYAQSAVYGQRIEVLEDKSKDVEVRLRSIESKLERLIVLAEAAKDRK
jgi:hypothetical protein